MTLFTTLLVMIAERLFKLGEHWQLDHRLEALFRRVKHYSFSMTILMTLLAMLVVYLIQRALDGLLFNVPLLLMWVLVGVLCMGLSLIHISEPTRRLMASRMPSSA